MVVVDAGRVEKSLKESDHTAPNRADDSREKVDVVGREWTNDSTRTAESKANDHAADNSDAIPKPASQSRTESKGTILLCNLSRRGSQNGVYRKEHGKQLSEANSFIVLMHLVQFGLKDESLFKNQGVIAGKWQDAKDGSVIKVTST